MMSANLVRQLGIAMIIGFSLLALPVKPQAATVPAFPGAEGFGAAAIGGRGGKVLEVTNLNSDGPGSFRHACEATGPRIVVFRTGGTIQSNKDIEITEPYVTIAGQTAPGDGICIRGAALRIPTHDVIVRGLRIRVGDDSSGPNPVNRDGIGIDNPRSPPRNIIIDHCSVSWAMDENMATWFPCHNITVQWCLISEALLALDEESYGLLIGDDASHITIHHNLFAHNKDRCPMANERTLSEIINNVIYNWRWYATRTSSSANIIGNTYKVGPNWTGGKEIAIDDKDIFNVFVLNNIGPHRSSSSISDWALVNGSKANYQSSYPVMMPSGVIAHDGGTAYEIVLSNAGAIVPTRDPVDVRVIRSVRAGTGSIIHSQSEVGGWPQYKVGTPLADTDHDGMPDSWESAHGLDPTDPSDANADDDGDGYTYIEDHINGLIPVVK